MSWLRKMAARSRVFRALLFALLFPFFYVYAFIRYGLAWKPFGLTAENGQIKIPWQEVRPLDEMQAVLDARRLELTLSRVSGKMSGRSFYFSKREHQ